MGVGVKSSEFCVSKFGLLYFVLTPIKLDYLTIVMELYKHENHH
jgi:hypothetical protein